MTENERDLRRTERVKKLYLYLFGQPFPDDWTIIWHVQGVTAGKDKVVYLAADSLRDPYDLETCVHELCHIKHYLEEGKHEHTDEFMREARRLFIRAKRIRR